jgi:hypothetical protein
VHFWFTAGGIALGARLVDAREVVLKEKPVEAGFVPLDALGIKPAAKAAAAGAGDPAAASEAREEVGSFGD